MNFTDKHLAVMRRALATWGERQQVIKAIEELSELQQALCKWLNVGVQVREGLDAGQALSRVDDELADVTIMLHQLRQIFDDSTLHARVDAKLERLVRYLPEETQKERDRG